MKPSERITELFLERQQQYIKNSPYPCEGEIRLWLMFDAITDYLDEQSEKPKEKM